MTSTQTLIENALTSFATADLLSGARTLLNAMGYDSEKIETLSPPNADGFSATFGGAIAKRAQAEQWKELQLVFQLTDEELGKKAKQSFKQERFDSFLFFALDLKPKAGDKPYSRTELANMARELNKPFPAPVIVIFRHGDTASLASLHRRPDKRNDNRDVSERVVLLKDIRLGDPHRAHLEILGDLAKIRANSWEKFLKEWNRVLDISELNKKFYNGLFDWFEAAKTRVSFPDSGDNAAERGLIRLITRLIFTWFVKERGLVPAALFESDDIEKLLKDSGADADTYYRAVLQNLFFATLNRSMTERGFAPEGGGVHRQKGEYANTTLWRYRDDFADPAQWERTVAGVPFLNGGLFECLDHNPSEGNYVDGFSRVEKKQAHLPNSLFWGDNFTATLTDTSDEKKTRSAVITPILNLLHSYKFTIDENTPLEEDVALDPELLGKVFENLLASYNPETRTTARKQTGSFYTPREIVSYMVEQALQAYLGGALEAAGQTLSADAQTDEPSLATLLLETDARSARELGFGMAQIQILIGALENVTVLDPACGSGAFPMGALSKMVGLLKKLDPNNELWLDAQLNAVNAALVATKAEPGVIAEAQAGVRAAFARNDPDYARKLYLIERCLFGVDIQTIALQIAKLRFFIALIIDQRIDASQSNLNIRALPNLETRFVAANTLLSLPQREQLTLDQANSDLTDKFAELDEVRRQHIAPKTRRDKKDLEARDKQLRAEALQLMKDEGYPDAVSGPIAAWNPYDQNAVAAFFEPEKMFGPNLCDGFDIVIGNPPYVAADKQDAEMRVKIFQQLRYQTLWERWDLYIPFIEFGYKILRPGGVTTMIVSDAFCHAKYAIKPQKWYLENAIVRRLDFLRDIKVFEAQVSNVVYFIQKPRGEQKAEANTPERRLHVESFGNTTSLPTKAQKEFDHRAFFPEDGEAQQIQGETTPLADIFYVSKGMAVHAHEHNAPGEFELSDLVQKVQDKEHPRAFIEGKHIGRWLPSSVRYIEWGTNRAPKLFSRPTFSERYDVVEKLVSVDMSAGPNDKLRVAYDDNQLLHNHSAWSFVPWYALKGVRNTSLKKATRYKGEKPPRPDLPSREELEATSEKFSLKYLLGVMNSSPARDFLRANRRSNIHLYPDDWKKLPIPVAKPDEQWAIAGLVEQILAARADDVAADVSQLEAQIDALVYALYDLLEHEIALVEAA